MKIPKIIYKDVICSICNGSGKVKKITPCEYLTISNININRQYKFKNEVFRIIDINKKGITIGRKYEWFCINKFIPWRYVDKKKLKLK